MHFFSDLVVLALYFLACWIWISWLRNPFSRRHGLDGNRILQRESLLYIFPCKESKKTSRALGVHGVFFFPVSLKSFLFVSMQTNRKRTFEVSFNIDDMWLSKSC